MCVSFKVGYVLQSTHIIFIYLQEIYIQEIENDKHLLVEWNREKSTFWTNVYYKKVYLIPLQFSISQYLFKPRFYPRPPNITPIKFGVKISSK